MYWIDRPRSRSAPLSATGWLVGHVVCVQFVYGVHKSVDLCVAD